MKTRLPILRAFFLFLIVTLCSISSAHATPAARWSIAFKGGYYVPSLPDWKSQYGTRGGTQLGLNLGFKLTTRLEIGLEGGYFSDERKALTVTGVSTLTDQKFKLFPLQAYLLYRLNFKKDQMLVPYLGGGYSRFTYRTSLEGADTIKGAQEGYHYRSGFAFLLDRIDPDAAVGAEDWGLIDSYLFVEAQYAKVNDFGNAAIDLGGWTYSGGFLYEF